MQIENRNRELIERIVTELSRGNDQPFLAAMAHDMEWTWMGSGGLFRTFKGKEAITGELWESVKRDLAQL